MFCLACGSFGFYAAAGTFAADAFGAMITCELRALAGTGGNP